MKIKFKRKEFDDYVSSLILIHLFIMCGKNMLVALIPFFYNNNSIINKIVLLFFAGMYIYLFLNYNIYKRISVWATLYLIFIALFFLSTVILNPSLLQNSNVTERLRSFIAYCLPLWEIIYIFANKL